MVPGDPGGFSWPSPHLVLSPPAFSLLSNLSLKDSCPSEAVAPLPMSDEG